VIGLGFVSDEVDRIAWNYGAEEQMVCLRNTNVVIGAYVTAGARIHFYRYLDRLAVEVL